MEDRPIYHLTERQQMIVNFEILKRKKRKKEKKREHNVILTQGKTLSEDCLRKTSKHTHVTEIYTRILFHLKYNERFSDDQFVVIMNQYEYYQVITSA